MIRFRIALALILTFNFTFAGTPANKESFQPDFTFFSEYPPQSLIESYPYVQNEDLIIEVEGLVTPEEINQITNSNLGTQLWLALKTKTSRAKEILKSYPNILKYIRSKAPPLIRKILTQFKVREKYQNILVGNAEQLLDTAPEVILQANAEGFGVRLTLIGVAGIGDLLSEKMNEFKWLQKLKEFSKKIPFKISFPKFFGFGLGAGVILLKFKAHDKNYAILRFHANGEYPKRIINFAFDGYLGIPTQIKVSESINTNEVLKNRVWIEKTSFERSHLSMAGGITSEADKGRYQHELYLINTPSPFGSVSFYEMNVDQIQFNWVFNVDWIHRIAAKFKKLKNSCKKSVSSS